MHSRKFRNKSLLVYFRGVVDIYALATWVQSQGAESFFFLNCVSLYDFIIKMILNSVFRFILFFFLSKIKMTAHFPA